MIQKITERGVIGTFFDRLEQPSNLSYLDKISNYYKSDQAQEQYPFLGSSPTPRKWEGRREIDRLSESVIVIKNEKYEATMEIDCDDIRRDKTGQVVVRINELADGYGMHFASILSHLSNLGASAVCYDGNYFFATDHSEGDSGSQSNKLSVDISTLPTSIHGSTTFPSVGEMSQAILQGIQAILGFKDNKGNMMNQGGREFLVQCPISLMGPVVGGVSNSYAGGLEENIVKQLAQLNFNVDLVVDPVITATDSIYVLRTDAPVKPYIRQEELPVSISVLGEGSDYCVENDAWLVATKAIRSVGYGRWQRACKVTLI